MTRTTLLAASAVVLSLAGCGSSNEVTGTNGDGGTPLVTEVPCSEETRATPYSAGMEEQAPDGTVVKILSASPAPPHIGLQANGRYNDWVLQVTGPDGGVVTGASVSVDPKMPDHNHHSPFKPSIHENADGTYSATRIDFNMHGFWQVTVTVGPLTLTGAHDAVFPLCVE